MLNIISRIFCNFYSFEANKELSLISERHKVFENGTLMIRDMNGESDRGKYTCTAISRTGEEIQQDLHIDVMSKY